MKSLGGNEKPRDFKTSRVYNSRLIGLKSFLSRDVYLIHII